jgi:hypothetical protein
MKDCSLTDMDPIVFPWFILFLLIGTQWNQY